METDVAQHLAGVLVVARELRATKVMVPGVDGVNTLAACFLLQKLNELLCNTVYATHGRDYPNLVACSHFAVLTHITLEGSALIGDVQLFLHRIVGVLQSTGKIGLEIVLVNPLALLQVFLCVTDRVAVLDDVLSFGSIIDEHLVTGRSILQKGDGLAIYLNSFALLHRAQANHY